MKDESREVLKNFIIENFEKLKCKHLCHPVLDTESSNSNPNLDSRPGESLK